MGDVSVPGAKRKDAKEMYFILRSGFDATVIAGVEISLHLQWASMAVASQFELLTSQTRVWKSEVIWPVIQCMARRAGASGMGESNLLGTEWVRWSFASTDVSGTTMKPVCLSNGSRHLLTRLLRAVIDRSATKKEGRGSAIENMPGMQTSDIRGSLAQSKAPFTVLSLMCCFAGGRIRR